MGTIRNLPAVRQKPVVGHYPYLIQTMTGPARFDAERAARRGGTVRAQSVKSDHAIFQEPKRIFFGKATRMSTWRLDTSMLPFDALFVEIRTPIVLTTEHGTSGPLFKIVLLYDEEDEKSYPWAWTVPGPRAI